MNKTTYVTHLGPGCLVAHIRCCYSKEGKLPLFANTLAIDYKWFNSFTTTSYDTAHLERVNHYFWLHNEWECQVDILVYSFFCAAKS